MLVKYPDDFITRGVIALVIFGLLLLLLGWLSTLLGAAAREELPPPPYTTIEPQLIHGTFVAIGHQDDRRVYFRVGAISSFIVTPFAETIGSYKLTGSEWSLTVNYPGGIQRFIFKDKEDLDKQLGGMLEYMGSDEFINEIGERNRRLQGR
jgi:hypothetical protein